MTGILILLLSFNLNITNTDISGYSMYYGEYRHNVTAKYPVHKLRKYAKYHALRMAVKQAWKQYATPIIKTLPGKIRRKIKRKIFRRIGKYLNSTENPEEHLFDGKIYFFRAEHKINVAKLIGDVKRLAYFKKIKTLTLKFEDKLSMKLRKEIIRFFRRPDIYLSIKYFNKKYKKRHKRRHKKRKVKVRKSLCKSDFCINIRINSISSSTLKNSLKSYEIIYSLKTKTTQKPVEFKVKSVDFYSLPLQLPSKLLTTLGFTSTVPFKLKISGLLNPIQIIKTAKLLIKQEKYFTSIDSYNFQSSALILNLTMLKTADKTKLLKNLFFGQKLLYNLVVDKNGITELQIKEIPVTTENPDDSAD